MVIKNINQQITFQRGIIKQIPQKKISTDILETLKFSRDNFSSGKKASVIVEMSNNDFELFQKFKIFKKIEKREC